MHSTCPLFPRHLPAQLTPPNSLHPTHSTQLTPPNSLCAGCRHGK
jgi:hypothetical protein